MKRNEAAFLMVQLAISAAVLGLVALPSFTSTNAGSTTEPYSVISTVTATGGLPSNLQCYLSSCPPPQGGVPSPYSLSVELIEYNGTLYYRYQANPKPGYLETMTETVSSPGGVSVSTITTSIVNPEIVAWLTNSTVYCVSANGQAYGVWPACPG